MAAQPPTFLLDGKAYNVLVTSHSRSFSILDSEKPDEPPTVRCSGTSSVLFTTTR